MKSLTVTIRRIGNSQGIVIPKPLLAQVGLEGEAEMTVEDGALVLRKPGFDFPQDFVGYAGDITRSFQRLSY